MSARRTGPVMSSWFGHDAMPRLEWRAALPIRLQDFHEVRGGSHRGRLPSPARLLYTSAWFQKVRDIVEASGARWFVLSSRYGLVAPDTEIAPYDYTLNTLGVAERRAWASAVLNKLLPELAGENRVVMFAGHRYHEFLVEPLRKRGIEVEVPVANLTRGEQFAWLSVTE